MSWFGANRNGGHNDHLMMERGPKAAVYGYSAASRESYAASTEQVVQYGSPTSMELHKLPGVGDHPLLRRVFNPTHQDWDHRSSTRAKDSHDHNKFHMDSSPTRDHHYGKYINYNTDESDDDEKYPKPKNMRDEDYERERHRGNGYSHGNRTHPNSISHPQKDPHHETSYNPHGTYTVPVSVNPKKDNPHENYPSPPTRRVSFPSKEDNPHNNYASPPYTAPISTNPKKDPYDRDNYYEKPKGGSYSNSPPPYTEPISTNPKKDPYDGDNYYQKPKGGSYSNSPPSYTRKDTYHDAPNRPMTYNNPPASIKTKPERGTYRDGTSSPGSPFSPSNGSPFTSSPRKDNHETIDSVEARRRYGKASSPMGGAHVEKHVGVIDSQEAARKYNGIFVNY